MEVAKTHAPGGMQAGRQKSYGGDHTFTGPHRQGCVFFAPCSILNMHVHDMNEIKQFVGVHC